MIDRGDCAVNVTIYSMDGSALDYRILAQVQTWAQQLVWGTGKNDLAYDISYVEVPER